MNSTCNTFELLDFRKTDWSGLCASIKSVNWKELLHHCIPSKYISVIIETLGNLCSVHVPAKHSKKTLCIKVSQSNENFDEEEIKTLKNIPSISFHSVKIS